VDRVFADTNEAPSARYGPMVTDMDRSRTVGCLISEYLEEQPGVPVENKVAVHMPVAKQAIDLKSASLASVIGGLM
jgi:hypothetical protein